MELQDGDHGDIETGPLLRPAAAASASASSSPSTPSTLLKPPSPPVLSKILWTLAFYAPATAIPFVARVLVIHRDDAVLGFVHLLKGAAFGCLQDAAVFLQTLVFTRLVLSMRDSLIAGKEFSTALLINVISALCLAGAYLWLTLATFVDLGLLMNFLPRLNRGFVRMYLQFADQFTSSMHEVISVPIVCGLLLYVVSMYLWIVAVLGKKVRLPTFGLLFCQSSKAEEPSTTSQKPGPPPAPMGVFPCVVHLVLTSLTVRTLLIALMTSVSALHATIAVDGNGNDIYMLSNAMFALETEDMLRVTPPEGGDHEANARVRAFRPCIERVIGRNEMHVPALGPLHSVKYPMLRKTVTYTGEKRFHISPKTPPTVLLFNMESMRAREIGVIGGRWKKAMYNQTATPFFDELSKSGILFREHYTPSIQTSRTLLSTLFGILPSLTVQSAVSRFPSTKLHLRGIPQILKDAFNYQATFWSAVDHGWEDWRGFLSKHGFTKLVDEHNVLDYLTEERKNSLTDEDKFSWGRHDPVSFEALESYLEQYHKQDDTSKQPLFMDIYSITSHDPFPTPPRFKPSSNYSTFLTPDNKGYVDALNFVDQQLEKLITNLRKKNLLKNTIVLIEGDHGYGRMEHGNNPTIASSRVYEEAVHIPLLILADDFLPENEKGKVIDEVSSQSDILATIMDMVGVKNFVQHGVGQSLVRKGAADRGAIIENPYDGRTIGVRVGKSLKYVKYGSGKYYVYNLETDPEEKQAVEKGNVEKGFKRNETEVQIRYAEQVVDMAQYMYETNSFMPSPEEFQNHTRGHHHQVLRW